MESDESVDISDICISDNRISDNRISDNRISDNRISDNRISDNQYQGKTKKSNELDFIHIKTEHAVKKPKKIVRVMTYNVHGFKNMCHKKNIEPIISVIIDIDPDIFVLEEVYVHKKNESITENELIEKLKIHGFVHNTFSSNGINAVFSKHPFEFNEINLGRDKKYKIARNALICKFIKCKNINCNLHDLIFVGTHLDVFDESGELRKKQVSIILDSVKDINKNISIDNDIDNADTNDNNRIIIAGDFNSLRRDDYSDSDWEDIVKKDKKRGVKTVIDAITIIEGAGFVDSFPQCKKSISVSVWAGRRVDYIYGKNIKFNNSFSYKKTFSDHYPIYADF
jgi:endonuclease/exonuclease/phosphatase family metal-dependent hydrolase